MLPPAQVRHSLLIARSQPLISHAVRASAAAVLRTGVATNHQRRSFWGWRRHKDWTSHLDPLYHRFCRVRTLKTRAKLLKKLQRRGKFEWEGHGAEFFTPKHVRWATRWDGPGGRRPWWIYPTNENGGTSDINGREVGKEAEKGKNGEDGYELSQREKIWKEQMERMRKRIESDPYEAIFGKRFEPFWSPLVPSWMREEMGLPVWKMKSSAESAETTKKTEPEVEKAEGKTPKTFTKQNMSKAAETMRKAQDQVAPTPKPAPEAPKSTSCSYASSTSWDSWSNKTRRVEWDSVSNQTKKFEYDPISNRMVLVDTPKAAESKRIESTPAANKKTDTDAGATNIPVKQSTDTRKAIPIPPPLSQASHSIPIGFSTTMTTSVGPWKSTAIASDVPKSTAMAPNVHKPCALATRSMPEEVKQAPKPKEEALESLTADDVRANMGKTRSLSTEQLKTDHTKGSVKTQVDALLSERHISGNLPIRSRQHVGAATEHSEWDKAELNVLYDKELDSLYKKKEKLLKDEGSLFHIERQKRELIKLDTRIKELIERLGKLNEKAAITISTKTSGLQSSLDRMQSKPTPRAAIENEDADDSAAHESTEPIDSISKSTVPKDWANQADLLQAERVRRSAVAKGLYPPAATPKSPKSPTSSITPAEIAARKKANEARRAADEAKAAAEIAKIKAEKVRLDREKKLEKANALLESEVKEQKLRMQSHETRYAHKIRALRGELEVAYRQSAVHGEKHVERIKDLTAELEKAQKAIGEKTKERQEVSSPGQGWTNWYQQSSAKMAEGRKANLDKLSEQQKKDRELVKEIKGIYEKAYGPIDAQAKAGKESGKKTGVVEVESNVDLGEALAKYEKEHDVAYSGKIFRDASEKELQAREREANEGVKLVDDKMPRLIPTELSKTSATSKEGVQWAEPPLYKVLAYDSGNDILSTATTTSNFTGSEAPISIPEALSQLYAPARFVSSFATLQKEGYQVIHGTKDLLVFRKVADPTATEVEQAVPALEDHGLIAGQNHPDHWTNWRSEAAYTQENTSGGVNPIDGTVKASSTGAKSSDQGVEPRALLQNALLKDGSTKPEKADAKSSSPSVLPDESHNVFDTETDWRHYPRVKREEYPVFTGTRRKWYQGSSKQEAKQSTKSERKAEKKSRKERRRQRRQAWRRVIGTGLVAAGVAYGVGAAAEKGRKGPSGGGGTAGPGTVGRGSTTGHEWLEKVGKAKGENNGWMWRS